MTGQVNAVVLLSGGLDSATVLASARASARACWTVAFDYGQRHRHELKAAERISTLLGARKHMVFPIDLRCIGGSALTTGAAVTKDRDPAQMESAIPATYVPARNLVFLSIAAAIAEVAGAQEIHLGVNAVDYSGYPDCRPAFIEAFERTVNLATKAGVEGRGVRIVAPLLNLTKAQIIQLGIRLGVDYSLTHSCYDPETGPGGEPLACGRCDSCILRKHGFAQAGVPDPTRYAKA